MPRNNPTSEERIRFLTERKAELVLSLNAHLDSPLDGRGLASGVYTAIEYYRLRLTEELAFAEWLLVQDPVT